MGALQGSLSSFMLPAGSTFYSGRKGKIYSTKEAHQPLWSWNTNIHCSGHSPSSGKSGTNEISAYPLPVRGEKRAPPKGNWGTTEAADGLLTCWKCFSDEGVQIWFASSILKEPKKSDDRWAAGLQRISKTAVSNHVLEPVAVISLEMLVFVMNPIFRCCGTFPLRPLWFWQRPNILQGQLVLQYSWQLGKVHPAKMCLTIH